MDASRVDKTVKRIAHQIAEQNDRPDELVLVSVGKSALSLTLRLTGELSRILGRDIPHGLLDITLYRDDLGYASRPRLHETRLDFSIDKKTVILVDDVIFTGRTLRAALDALLDFGRPDLVRAAVIVDRGHRELPIRGDYVGLWLDTVHDEEVAVRVGAEPSDADSVWVIGLGAKKATDVD